MGAAKLAARTVVKPPIINSQHKWGYNGWPDGRDTLLPSVASFVLVASVADRMTLAVA